MEDLSVLTWQKVIPGHDWSVFKSNPDLMERYLANDARQHVAARIAEERLARYTVSEPDPDSDDPLRLSNAVLRLTVAVASRDEAATLAAELCEAEDRGFRRAIQAMEEGLESVVPGFGPTAYARAALDMLLHKVVSAWDHRPAADWLPMRTCPHHPGLEYWFLTGDIGQTPHLRVPTRSGAAFDAGVTAETITHEDFNAIAWRYAGRPPHRVAA